MARGPQPHPRCSPPTPRPPDSPSPGYRWPAAPTSSAATATSSGAAAAPRLPAAPMAAGAPVRVDQSARRRPAGVMLRGGRLGGADDPASSSSTPAAHGPQSWPRRTLKSAREGSSASAATNSAARPQPRATAALAPSRDLRAGSTSLHPGPLGSRPRPLWAAICGRPDKRTNGQKDARTGGQAPGLAGAGRRSAGARAARPVNNEARQLGPVQAAVKGGADPHSEGTRRLVEAREGWRKASQREAPPRPPASLSRAPR